MQCNYPLTIKLQNGRTIDVKCGRCMACRINRTTEWTTRIIHEGRLHRENVFITLTYNEQCLPVNESVSKRDLQLFFKRLRKNIVFRYFACGEYGENKNRPHYHAILFGVSQCQRQLIEKAWSDPVKKIPMGFVHIGTLTGASAQYCAKYVQKQLFGVKAELYEERQIQKEFVLMSRRPGIGSSFAEKYLDSWEYKGFIIVDGLKRSMPRYYKNKYPQETQREISMRNSINRIENWKRGGEQQSLSWKDYIESQEQNEKNQIAKSNLKKGVL